MKQNRFLVIFLPILLFSILLSVRLFFSFKTAFLSGVSYQHLLIAENPLQGHVFANSVFYYSLSLLLFFSKNVMILKVFSNVFFVLSNVMIYFIALRISKSCFFSFFAALFSGFLPIYFSETFDLLSPLSFGLFLLFFTIYSFFNAEKKGWIFVYVFSFILFSFSHWLVIFYIVGLAIYFVVLKIEGVEFKPVEVELSLFSIFFGLWAQILVCKKLLLLQGFSLFKLNVPDVLLSSYFSFYPLSKALTLLGVIPLLAGLFVMYKYLFENKGKSISLIISFVILVSILYWFSLMLTVLALILGGLFFCILLARWFSDIKYFISTTKGGILLNFLMILLILFISFLVLYPAFYYSSSKLQEYDKYDVYAASLWLQNNSDEDAVVLALPEESSFASFYSGRKFVINDDFLNFEDAASRLSDVYRVYNTRFSTEALGILEKYDASYILLSEQTKKQFDIEFLSYAVSARCFSKVFEDGAVIYEKNPDCRLRVFR